jgi:hypothetical protein
MNYLKFREQAERESESLAYYMTTRTLMSRGAELKTKLPVHFSQETVEIGNISIASLNCTLHSQLGRGTLPKEGKLF